MSNPVRRPGAPPSPSGEAVARQRTHSGRTNPCPSRLPDRDRSTAAISPAGHEPSQVADRCHGVRPAVWPPVVRARDSRYVVAPSLQATLVDCSIRAAGFLAAVPIAARPIADWRSSKARPTGRADHTVTAHLMAAGLGDRFGHGGGLSRGGCRTEHLPARPSGADRRSGRGESQAAGRRSPRPGHQGHHSRGASLDRPPCPSAQAHSRRASACH